MMEYLKYNFWYRHICWLFVAFGVWIGVFIGHSFASARVFTNAAGQQIKAELVKIDGERVQIRRADGAEFWIAINTLSARDQAYISEFRSARALDFSEYSIERVQLFARRIDELLQVSYGQSGIQPNSIVTDPVFLRRTYLAIVGRIPTYSEAIEFSEDRGLDKRSKLVDRLLQTEGHLSAQFNYWADVLRILSEKSERGGAAYADWVKTALRTNMPFDEFVRQLITAEGGSWENGAVGYYLRDRGMELDNMSNTAQIFLGTQLVCAQCHDHPFDKWTQRQYYELAAFTYSTRTYLNIENKRKLNKLIASESSKDRRGKLYYKVGELFRGTHYGAQDSPRQLKLPHDYQYDDARPQSVVLPKTPFGQGAELTGDKSKRQIYAEWLTNPDNPRFTKVIANRMWKHVMGRGVFEPIDALTDDTPEAESELIQFLTKMMVALNYDLRQFQRVLYHTKLYQREAYQEDISLEKPYHFPGPLLRRLSAEQLWDSMLTLTIPEPDQRIESTYRHKRSIVEAKHKADTLMNTDPEVLMTSVEQVVALQQSTEKKLKPIRMEIAQKRKTLTTLVPSSKKAESLQAIVKQLRKEYYTLEKSRDQQINEIVFGSRNDVVENSMMAASSDTSMMMRPASSMEGSLSGSEKDASKERWNDYRAGLVRASEYASPAPLGHFLRQFGQSDREMIENASYAASVPQVLTLLNGPYFNELLKPSSVLSQNVARAVSPLQKLRVIYMSILGRLPTERELAIMKSEIRKRDDAPGPYSKYQTQDVFEPMDSGYQNVVWALLNTRQFLFIE